jgi:hypothetical protein
MLCCKTPITVVRREIDPFVLDEETAPPSECTENLPCFIPQIGFNESLPANVQCGFESLVVHDRGLGLKEADSVQGGTDLLGKSHPDKHSDRSRKTRVTHGRHPFLLQSFFGNRSCALERRPAAFVPEVSA